MFYRVKRVKGRCYLVREWWDPVLGKKITRSVGPCEWLEQLAKEARATKQRPRRRGTPRRLGLVPRPGFEPGSRAREARILGRAILPRHHKGLFTRGGFKRFTSSKAASQTC